MRQTTTRPAAPAPPRPGATAKKPPPSPQAKAYRRKKAKAHAQVEARCQADVAHVVALPIRYRHACGIDIGQSSHWVCTGFTDDPDGQADRVKEFPAHTDGLHALVAHLKGQQVTTVAMESTSFYWVPLYELLEKEGFAVLLVDPSYTRQLKGRPKTDRRDAQWIYRLHAVGLLAGAFRPDEATCVLRRYLRLRGDVIRQAVRHVQHLQAALEQMNLKLTGVLDDVTGVSGRKIITAILKGTRDPSKLAALRHPYCHASDKEMEQALTGSYRDEHLFALRQAFDAWRFCQKQLDEVDGRIALQLGRMKGHDALPPLPKKTRQANGNKANQPRFDVREALYPVVGFDLTELEGVSEVTALAIVSEIGTDLSRFATVKHFASWLGLCPGMRKTGGQVKSSRVRPGKNRAAQALRLAASGLHNSKGALGAYLRRMKSRLGAPAAITATAHKLARLVYYALKHGIAYARQSQEEYEQQQRERLVRNLKKRARQLGLEVSAKEEAGRGRNEEGPG